jgi:predicted secreted protein
MAGSKLSIAKSIPPATTHAATTVGNFKINLTGEIVDSSSIDGSYFFIKKKGIAVTISTSDTQRNGTKVVCPNSQIIAGPPAKPSDIDTAYIAIAFGRIF